MEMVFTSNFIAIHTGTHLGIEFFSLAFTNAATLKKYIKRDLADQRFLKE